MGHVRVPVRVGNPNQRQEAIGIDSALVDTGATWTTIPRSLSEQLGLDIVGRVKVRTAAGPQEVDQSFAYLELEGKYIVTFVLVSDTYPGVLIGVTTLEGLGFAVDPAGQRLVDAELLLL